MTTAQAMTEGALSGGANYVRSLEIEVDREVVELVDAALREVGEKKDSLSARLAFGKLNGRVRPIPLRPPETAPTLGLDPDPYLVEDVVARVAFAVGLSELFSAADLPDVLTTLYRTGSEREQVGVLRALPFLPDGERLVGLAREASRTNDVTVFSALACNSDFPARHLPDAAFEQLVLKALFLGVPAAQITRVATRVTSELQRMIADFASERRAAGRPVPSDVPWLLGQSPTPNRATPK